MKKIALNKETVRKLNDRQLEQANGGKPKPPPICDTHVTLCELPYTCIPTVVTCAGATCFGNTCQHC